MGGGKALGWGIGLIVFWVIFGPQIERGASYCSSFVGGLRSTAGEFLGRVGIGVDQGYRMECQIYQILAPFLPLMLIGGVIAIIAGV